jgi:hypothetical protein
MVMPSRTSNPDEEVLKVTTDNPATDPQLRAAFIAGLLDLACFLEAHPDLPVQRYGQTVSLHTRHEFSHDGTWAGELRALEAFASAIGAKVTEHGGYYYASRSFGPVAYEACAISPAARTRSDAENSYRDSIRLDEPERPALVSVACEHCDGTGYCTRFACETCKDYRAAAEEPGCGACGASAVRLVENPAA